MSSKPNFFVTAASVHGDFMKTDMESYLALIRRKIQQKCATTQDLIQSIRRNKIGDSGHVTPNEFRFTLIKFGVILSQPLVDKIFCVFDSDRSGTMDFDEFAMWIMNSEFHASNNIQEKVKFKGMDNAGKERLRQKLLVCIKENEALFKYMKKSVSFTEFISEVNRKPLPITEKEARAMFMLIDPTDTGFMDTVKLKHWAACGTVQTPPPTAPHPSQARAKPLPLHQAIYKVCGQNTLLMWQSIMHLPRGKGVRIPFEEFRRCLLSNGLGQNLYDTKDLYEVLCGDSIDRVRGASVDVLYAALHVPERHPEQEVSAKKEKPSFSFTSHAHRRLREALRKSYKLLKSELEAADRQGTGFIDAQIMYQMLLKHSMQLSFQDFRYIMLQFKTEDNASKVNWQQFLQAYLPTNAPHMLDGVAASIPAPPAQHVTANGTSSTLAAIVSPVRTRPNVSGATEARPEVEDSSGTYLHRGGKTAPTASSKPLSMKDEISTRNQDPHAEMRRIWQAVLRECHRSDPDRSGCVSRIAFINALENANLTKAMSPQSMAKLADKYTTQLGLIDYLSCFRTYLTAIAQKPPPEPKRVDEKKVLEIKCHHPWDFDYNRSKSAAVPYWSSAATMPRDFADMVEKDAARTHVPPLEKSVAKLTADEVDALRGKYSEKCLVAARKVYATVNGSGSWKTMKNEFRSLQINSQKGAILTTVFYTLMQKYSVKLSVSEMHCLTKELRGHGNQDVVRYEELMRLCAVCGKHAD